MSMLHGNFQSRLTKQLRDSRLGQRGIVAFYRPRGVFLWRGTEMRKLKYHEKKLLKRVDLFHWKAHDNLNENFVMRKFHIQERDDYIK